MSSRCWRRFEEVAGEWAGRPAVIAGGESITFADLRAAAERRAAELATAPGDRVLVSGPNSIAMAATILAVWRRGGVPVLIHPEASGRTLAHALTVTKPAVAFVEGVSLPDGGPDARPMALAADAAPGQLAPVDQPATAPASILFTSGSTGVSKGVTQSAENLMSGAKRVAGYLGYRADDRILCAIPFTFDYGWGQLLSTFLEGLTLVLPAQPNAFSLCEALERHAPTVLAGVPSLWADLLSGLSPIAKMDRSSIRLLTNTGSKIAPPLFGLIRETFPGAAISLNYGLTETYRTASLPFELADVHPDSVGFAIPGVEIGVVRPDGSAAEPEEEGEIIHRGAGAFIGYWGEPEMSARVLRPDPSWTDKAVVAPNVVYTGDLGRLDGAGRLYIHGRRDGQMKSMGVRVSRDEIELALQETGLIAEVAVVGRPHEMLGDMIVACVVPRNPADLPELKKQVRSRVNRFMQPRVYHLMERLPRNPNGKVDYPTLRALVNDLQ